MKKIITLGLALFAFAISAHAQDNKPKVTYQVGPAKVSVWENVKEGKYGLFTAKNFKVEKVYKKNEEWKSTSYFDLDELLQLRAAIDKAIQEEGVKIKEGNDE